MWKSMGRIIPYMMEKLNSCSTPPTRYPKITHIPYIMGKKKMFQTTNQMWIVSFPSWPSAVMASVRKNPIIESLTVFHIFPRNCRGKWKANAMITTNFSHQNCHKTAVHRILFFRQCAVTAVFAQLSHGTPQATILDDDRTSQAHLSRWYKATVDGRKPAPPWMVKTL